MNNAKPLCIYHGNCADGFTAAWAVWRRFGDAWDYAPANYGDTPPDVSGRDVTLVDFSYKRPVLLEMAQQSRTLHILDHHKTAAADLAGFVVPTEYDPDSLLKLAAHVYDLPIAALFDMNRSGAGIAWDFFHAPDTRPKLVKYAEDRDLWRFALPFSREVNAYIFAHEYDFGTWTALANLIDDETDAVVLMGAAIEKKHHKDVRELTAALRRRMMIGGYEVWAASLPYTLTSDAGHLMAQGEPFAACYWDTPEGRVFSLRSTDDGADVSAIAKQYGGGGHRNAAGFRLPHGVAP